MSEAAQGALIAGIAALAGVVVSQAVSVLLERRRELASYRVNLYAKRLEVHQEAFMWTQKLGRIVFLADSNPSNAQIKPLDQELRSLSDWFNENNLYLDPVSMHELVRLLPLCREWVSGNQTKESVTQQIEKALEAIVKGIGLKHIDFEAIKDDLRRIREQSDAK